MEKMMDRSTKTAAALLALAGGLFASAAIAEMGPGGMGGMGGMEGHGDRGGMFMEQFDLIDADKDGKITAAELAAHRQARFAAADTDADGKLTAEELTAYQVAQMAEKMAARTTKMLQWMDTNGDGGLSVDEMPDGPSPRHLARLDADGDGAISKAEAEAAVDRMGDRMKKHRNGMNHDD
jgi:Ca2+-binding EF-hand superfamily protein